MISAVLSGAGLLGRGARIILRRPKLFGLGALPAVITSILFLIILVTLLLGVDEIVVRLTPFADSWAAGWTVTLRILMGVALIAGSILLMVISFTALTLALGAPLYDKISEAVDEAVGELPPEREDPLGSQVARSVRQTIGLILISLTGAVVLFLIGLIPVVGNVAGAILSALFGGWMLAMELVGSALERRGVTTLAGRRAAMRTARAKVLGLGVPAFLLLSLPVVAIVVFPIATAAGTLLGRELAPTPESSAP